MNELELKNLVYPEFEDICSAYYRITMSNGDMWSIPVWTIMLNRAEYYAKVDDIPIDESLNEDTIPLFRDDEDEIEDWARNNMDWEDVMNVAEFTGADKGSVDYQEEWKNPKDVEII